LNSEYNVLHYVRWARSQILVKSFGLSSLIEPVTFYTVHISYKNG